MGRLRSLLCLCDVFRALRNPLCVLITAIGFIQCWSFEDASLVEFMYLVLFTGMPGEGYRRRLRSLLLCLCDVFES